MMRKIVNTFKIVLFTAMIFGIYFVLKFMTMNDVESLTRITMHELYEKSGQIDTLFIGPSHTFRGINTEEISNTTDRSCFALSTSAQDLAGSYFLLLEADRLNDLKDVYLEVSPTALSSEIGNEIKTYIIADYMEPTRIRYQYLYEVIKPESYPNALFAVCRNTNTLEKEIKLKEWVTTAVKKDASYFNYSYRGDESLYYVGRGHWRTFGSFAEKGVMVKATSKDIMLEPGVFNEGEIEYLSRIVEYCKLNQLNLHILVMPFSDLYVACQKEAYQRFHQFLSSYADRNAIPFIDFNAVSRQDLRLTNECFKDLDHLNETGSAIFTEFVKKYLDGKEDYHLYESALERLDDDQDKVFGLKYLVEKNIDEFGNTVVSMTPYFNMDQSKFLWYYSIVDGADRVLIEPKPEITEEGYRFTIGPEYAKRRLRIIVFAGVNNDIIYCTYIDV